jgi:hypothetical protein
MFSLTYSKRTYKHKCTQGKMQTDVVMKTGRRSREQTEEHTDKHSEDIQTGEHTNKLSGDQ